MNMKRNFLVMLSLSLVILSSCGKSGEYDSRAIESLDKLSATIGELESCSYTLNTVIKDNSEKHEALHDTYMSGPTKMYINSFSSRGGHMGWWYDTDTFSYLSYDRNEYFTYDAPENTLLLIDGWHEKLNVDFPASDFFYPTLTDDIIQNHSKIYYSEENIDNVACALIEAVSDKENLFIWINKETNLPHRIVVESRTEDHTYDAVFSNWKTNPYLPDQLFVFEPSDNYKEVELKPKK